MYRQRNRFLFILLCTLLLFSIVQAAMLQITVQDSIDNSTIPRAMVFLNGESYGRTNNNGQAFINHSGSDDPRIRVSMNGYDDWEARVNKNATVLLVNLTRMRITLNVTMYDSVSLDPVSGARVNISSNQGIQTKVTDISGTVSFEVNATTPYSLEITAPDYLPRRASVDMDTDDRNVQYLMLRADQFSFVLKEKNGTTAVPDAEVYMNTALAGRTDIHGVLTLPVPRGNVYTIVIKKDGYQTFTESREIGQTDALFSVVLEKAVIGAYISVYDENRAPVAGADIYFNGLLSGSTNQYGRHNSADLVSGNYSVEVRKAGFVALNRTIRVTKQNEDHIFELQYESTDLTLYVQEKDQKMVPDATILLNGQPSGATDDHGQYRTSVKFNTPYNITVIKDAYQPATVQKQFAQGNASVSVTIIIERSPDWGLITIIAIGAIGVLLLFAAIRKWSGQKRRHVLRRNEI